MKLKIISLLFLCVISIVAHADTYVRGYTKNNGTYVEGHYRSNPDTSRDNNYSTYGNTNPYTGRKGTVPNYDDDYSNYDSE